LSAQKEWIVYQLGEPTPMLGEPSEKVDYYEGYNKTANKAHIGNSVSQTNPDGANNKQFTVHLG